MVKVKLLVEDTNLPGPVVAVRWCVSKDAMDKLRELNVTKPHLLIVVANEKDGKYQEVDTKIVPLDQEMEYLEFRQPGKTRIFGCLVYANSDLRDVKKDLEKYFRNYYFSTHCNLVEADGEFVEPKQYKDQDFYRFGDSLGYGSIDVVVPDGYFAKEPSEWEKWWVNLWYESEPKNRCQFRKRRFLAYSVQPIVISAFVLYRAIIESGWALVLSLCGIRNIQYKAIFHPFVYDKGDACPHNSSSWFLTDSSGNERQPIYCLMMPMLQIVILSFISLLMWGASRLGLNIGSILMWFTVVNVVVISILVLCTVFDINLDKLFPEETPEEKAARKKRELEELYAQYQDLVCDGVGRKADISTLSARRKTFYLRFKYLKSKVCLPFAAN